MKSPEGGRRPPNKRDTNSQRHSSPQEGRRNNLPSTHVDTSIVSTEPAPPEKIFEVTEREKYLLQVMAHVILEGYLPHLRRHPGDKPNMEKILYRQLDKSTKIRASSK